MYYTFYALIVLVGNPTIPADLKALGTNQFKLREAATQHLQSLPGWTAPFFERRANNAKDLEVRTRCTRVQRKLYLKWKADLALALFPTIPARPESPDHRELHKCVKLRQNDSNPTPALPQHTSNTMP